MQILIVGLLVIASAVYALWTLMPVALRRATAGFLSTCPLPRALRERAAAAAKAGSGCGCDGCDHAPKIGSARQGGNDRRTPPASGSRLPAHPQPIVFHPRTKR